MDVVRYTVEEDAGKKRECIFGSAQWLVIRIHRVCFEKAARQYAAISEHVCTYVHRTWSLMHLYINRLCIVYCVKSVH